MGVARSTFYDAPAVNLDDVEIAGRMQMICDEFEACGYRRVGAELRHQGVRRQSQEDPAPDARERPATQAQTPICGYDRQQSR